MIKKQEPEIDIYQDYITISPIPKNIPPILPKNKVLILNPKTATRGERPWYPELVYPYFNNNNELLGYVIRINFESGQKITSTILWCKKPGGLEGWVLKTFGFPRPLYIAGKLQDAKQIVIAEGEKATEAALKITGKTSITWPGGAQQAKYANWQALKGYNILIWPDNDKGGKKAAEEIAAILSQIGIEQLKILTPPQEKEKGWDAADALKEGWDYPKFKQWAKESAVIYTPSEK